MKIRPVEAELFHADRQTKRWTKMIKILVTSHNFWKWA